MNRYTDARVNINGCLGNVKGMRELGSGLVLYSVLFDGDTDMWEFKEETIQKGLVHGWKKPICECGAIKLVDTSAYSHAPYCPLWKRGNYDI